MKEIRKAWEKKFQNYWEKDLPCYLSSLNESEKIYTYSIKEAIVSSGEHYSESEICVFKQNSFVKKFKEPFKTHLAAMEGDINQVDVLIKGINHKQDSIETIIKSAEAYTNGVKNNKKLILQLLDESKYMRDNL